MPPSLADIAAGQIDAEISGQVAPLQGQIGSLMGRETSALQGIGSLFGELQPFVSGEAQAVHQSFEQANAASRQIFDAAQARMNELKQSRAQEAQALSQQMGGPVAMSEFMAGVTPSENTLAATAPNQLLHGLAFAQAGEQTAHAFAGRVFPALRVEQEANARGYYEDQIRQTEQQIAAIKSQRGGLVNSRFNELQTQERDFELKQAQVKLDQLKADRDWQATKQTLHNEDVRLQLANKQFAFSKTQANRAFNLSKAGVTGTYGGQPTQAAKNAAAQVKLAKSRITSQELRAAATVGVSKQRLAEMIRNHQETEKIARQRLANQQQRNAMGIVDAVTGGSPAGATITEKQFLGGAAGVLALSQGKTNVYKEPGKNGRYYTYVTRHLTAQEVQRKYGSGFANDPQQLYDMLIGSNIPRAMALKLVRTKTGIGDFAPGKPVSYSAEDLHTIAGRSFNELRGIALARGFRPNPKRPATTQQFIDFILHTNPNVAGPPAP